MHTVLIMNLIVVVGSVVIIRKMDENRLRNKVEISHPIIETPETAAARIEKEEKQGANNVDITFFYGKEKITILMVSLSLFMIFATKRITYHKGVNVIASTTFGVYLIHDSITIRHFLWLDLFKNSQYQDSMFLVPYSITVVLIIFICCSIVDLIRQKLFERPFVLMLKKYSYLLEKGIKKIIGICFSVVFGRDTRS